MQHSLLGFQEGSSCFFSKFWKQKRSDVKSDLRFDCGERGINACSLRRGGSIKTKVFTLFIFLFPSIYSEQVQ